MAPPTRSLSVFDTRLSAIKPPSRRRKFGSSFMVETMLPRARPGWLSPACDARVGAGPRAERFVADGVEAVRRFLAPVAERADCAFTYADLQVVATAERRSPVILTPMRAMPLNQTAGPAKASETSP